MSELKIPDDLQTEYRIFRTGKNVRPTAEVYVKLIERVARAETDLAIEREKSAALAEELSDWSSETSYLSDLFNHLNITANFYEKQRVTAEIYFQTRKENAALKAENERMKAPLSDERWEHYRLPFSESYKRAGDGGGMTRRAFNDEIAARAAAPAMYPSCDHSWRIDTGGVCPICAKESAPAEAEKGGK